MIRFTGVTAPEQGKIMVGRGIVVGRRNVERLFDAELRRMLLADVPGYTDERGLPVRYLSVISERLITMAAGGNLDAIKYLMDRIDGRPTQTTENTNTEEVGDTLAAVLKEVAERRRKIIDLTAEERRRPPEENEQ
jgi:hypothetical protein